jgi:hypothetical protein
MFRDMRLQPGFWRKCRVTFRRVRITALLAVFIGICAVVWFNLVGLPDFLKRPLVEKLHARGIELEFTRLRLEFIHGLVAENVRVGDAKTPGNPSLSLAEVQLRLNFRALLHRKLQVDGLVLRRGKLAWPLAQSNALTLDNIQADLRFQTNDIWSLDNFKADFAGAKLALAGEIAHAPEIRSLGIFQRKKNGGSLQSQLQKLSDTLDQIHFTGTPQLNLAVNGDARDIHTFVVRLNISAPSARTPWGDARDIQFAANLTAPADAPANFDSSWDFWTNAQPYRLVWTARLAQLHSEKLIANSVACAGFWQAPELAITNLSAGLGGGQLEAAAQLNVATRELTFTNSSSFDIHAVAALLTEKTRARLAEFSWTQPPSLHANGSLILPAWTNRQPDLRAEVQPTIRLDGEVAFTNGAVSGVAIDSAQTHFSYSNLVWQLPDLALAQSKTRLELSGDENDGTKKYAWHIRGSFDPEAIRPFLTANNAIRGFKIATFAEPLFLDADVRGRLYDYGGIAARGRVALTNFTVRGQAMDSVAGELFYTNRVLEFFHPQLWRAKGSQTMTADRIVLDFNRRLIFFTNGFSTADPVAVTRAIGPKTAKLMEPYHFLEPPTALVNGCVPLRDINGAHDVDDADLRFDITRGAAFQWQKLRTPDIKGTIHWLGETLILTNVTAAFYGGSADGFAGFDFRPKHAGADYGFVVNVTNVNLHLLAADLASPTNRLAGALAGQLVVTHADSRDLQTWDGFGHASLRNGLIWEAPFFSILSPVLNTVVPGLGNSRATDATAKFTITNGVMFTDSLEIHSTLMQLKYSGTVDLKQNVNARVTAQLLRNTWVIGQLVSDVLWPVSKLFEYKVTGTLKNPKSEPLYVVPKILLMPLHPIRSLEGIFPGGETATNAPPGN